MGYLCLLYFVLKQQVTQTSHWCNYDNFIRRNWPTEPYLDSVITCSVSVNRCGKQAKSICVNWGRISLFFFFTLFLTDLTFLNKQTLKEKCQPTKRASKTKNTKSKQSMSHDGVPAWLKGGELTEVLSYFSQC